MSEQANRDGNRVTSVLFTGSDGGTYNLEGDETTGRIYVDIAGGGLSQIEGILRQKRGHLSKKRSES